MLDLLSSPLFVPKRQYIRPTSDADLIQEGMGTKEMITWLCWGNEN